MWFLVFTHFTLSIAAISQNLLLIVFLKLHILINWCLLIVYWAIILLIQIRVHAIELIKVSRFQWLYTEERERKKKMKLWWIKPDKKSCFSIIFHYAEYFIVLLFAHTYMLYQLVNKTLETRLLLFIYTFFFIVHISQPNLLINYLWIYQLSSFCFFIG